MLHLMHSLSCTLTLSKKLSISREVDFLFDCLVGNETHDKCSFDEIYELYLSKEIVRFRYANCLRYLLTLIDEKFNNYYQLNSIWALISVQYGSYANITAKFFSSEHEIQDYDISNYHQPVLIVFWRR